MEELNTMAAETAPQDSEQAATETAAAENDSTNAEQQQTVETQPSEAEDKANEASSIPAPGLTVRFNHETRELTHDDAVKYAQLGLESDSLREKLRYVAAMNGAAGINELLNSMIEQHDNERKNQLVSQFDGVVDDELVEKILSAEHERFKSAAGDILKAEQDAVAADQKSINERMAADFMEFNKEFPEIDDIGKVSSEVLKMAAEKGISLLDAQLRIQHQNNKKIKAADAAEKTAQNATAGKIDTSNADSSSAAVEAMRRGIWS